MTVAGRWGCPALLVGLCFAFAGESSYAQDDRNVRRPSGLTPAEARQLERTVNDLIREAGVVESAAVTAIRAALVLGTDSVSTRKRSQPQRR